MAKEDTSLKRLGGGRWQTRDGRYTIESSSARWVVVDAQQTDDLGLPLVLGPYASLTEAKAAIATLQGGPPAVSPLEARLAEARRARAAREANAAAGEPVDPSQPGRPGRLAEAAPTPPAPPEPVRSPLVPAGLRRVLVIGHASWNTMIRLEAFPEPGAASIEPVGWHETVGASGAGKAIALARLGIPVTLLAPLGNDDAGRRVRAALGQVEGLELRAILDLSGTARHVNLMGPAGARQSFLLHAGDAALRPDQGTLERLVRAADLVFLEHTAVARACLATVARLGRPIWTDLHGWDGRHAEEQALLDAADVATMSADGLVDPRPVLEQAIAAGRRLAVATRGPDGSIALTEDGAWLETPAVPATELLDANGAGDAFSAGLLLGLLVGHPLADALAAAARAGAIAVASPDLSGDDLTRRAILG